MLRVPAASAPLGMASSTPKMTFTYQYQATLTKLLQDYLVDLCREYLPYTANLEIDGVVCLSDGKDLSRQIVLKVHRTLPPLPPPVKGQGAWNLPRRNSLDTDSDGASWPRQGDLPPKEHWQKPTDLSRSPSWPLNIDRLKNSVASLSKQGSLYGADVPQDLSIKEPSKLASTASTGRTPLSALADSVQKTPFVSYGQHLNHSSSQKPAPLQLVNKSTPPVAGQKVVSLLYQKIMEGPKGAPMWRSSPTNMESKPLSASEGHSTSPRSHNRMEDELKEEPPEEDDDDPSLHQGEMLCKICSESVFGGFYALQTHTYEVHRRYVCKKCYSTFSLRCNLRRHERLHEGLKPYSCDSCDKTFSRSTDLRMHMQKHGGVPKLPGASIVCDKCTKTFTNVQNLRWHMYKVHKAQDEIWACTICEKLFHDKDDYHLHRESHTASLNKYQQQPKRARLDPEDSGDSNDGLKDDESAMRDEYQKELKAIDDEAVTMENDEAEEEEDEVLASSTAATIGGPSQSEDEATKNGRPCSNPTFTAIKQALASRQPPMVLSDPSAANSNSRNKRKRKGNPMKITVNASDSDEDVYDLSSTSKPAINIPLKVETVSPAAAGPCSPVPSTESDADPLQHSYNSDVLASSSMSHLSYISEQDATDHLQSLQALSMIRSPLVIEPDHTASSPMSLPRSSELLYSPQCNSPMGLSPLTLNNNVEDLSVSGKLTPDHRKYDPVDSSSLPPVDDGDDTKEYTCTFDGCTDMSAGFRAYENHFVGVHSRYPCKLCKQTFSGKNNRTRHMRNHNRAKIYPCPDCGKYFSRPDSMREHRFIHTASYQEDKCRRCHQEFQRKSLLLAHLKNCFRSARTKNGSIDESPYLGNYSPDNKNTSLMENSSLSLENSNTSLQSMGQVDLANMSEMTKVACVPLNIPKVGGVLSENNNEALLPKAGGSFSADDEKPSQVHHVIEQDGDKDEDDQNTSGNLVIDTSSYAEPTSEDLRAEAATAAV